MQKNYAYGAISVLAILAMLLPAKSIFARAEVSSSDDRVESRGEEVRTLKQENGDDDEDEAETGTLKQENNNDRDDDEDEEENEAEAHRSAVSSFVKSLLEVADRNKGGIGEEVREIAREEDEAEEKVSKAVEEVESRNWLKTFLVGTDYKNIGMIRSEIAKTQNRINRLTELLDAMTSSTGSVTTSEQIQNLTEAQTKLGDFIKLNEDKFSLFGWFVRLFNK